MKKKLNELTIINELRGASSFFPRPSPPPVSSKQPAQSVRMNRTVFPNAKTERSDRTTKPNAQTVHLNRTVEPNDKTERLNRTVFSELKRGTIEEDKRQTKRYSFQIYLDQETTIGTLKSLYKNRLGKKLGNSRIIREALDMYFEHLDSDEDK